jgi:hypothetical protein
VRWRGSTLHAVANGCKGVNIRHRTPASDTIAKDLRRVGTVKGELETTLANRDQSVEISTDDPDFLMRAERRNRERGEILALFRYSGAAGSKDFFLFDSSETFLTAVRRAPSQTSVIAFRQRQLPIRGSVDDDLIRAAREQIADDGEFLILDLEPHE